MKESMRKLGWEPLVRYARLQREPPLGARTAIYLIDYVTRLSDGSRQDYPVEMLTFQIGRAVGGVSFSFVPSDDGLRPCSCELNEARLVVSRLGRA